MQLQNTEEYGTTHQFKHCGKNDRLQMSLEDKQKMELAPTTYSPCKEVVLPRAPEWTIQPRRNLSPAAQATDLGPGEYESDKKFGESPKNFTLGIRREINIPVTAGPGEYNHEKADSLTKIRNPAWQWQNNLGRLEACYDREGGPGTYDDGYKFGQDSTAQEFGRRREDRVEVKPGPGEYQHERADGVVRQRSPAWEFGATTGRNEVVVDPCRGPGTYDDHNKFGSDSKAQAFGTRREEKTLQGPGPGEYRHEQADGTVKQRNPAWDFKNTVGRVDQVIDPNGGPGSYNHSHKFGDDTKAQEFGIRRDLKIPDGPGPGQYKHEDADGITRQRNAAWDFKNQTGRKDAEADPTRGPGTYDDNYKFGDDSNAQVFGVRREEKIPIGPGPGDYRHECAEGLIRQRSPAWEWLHNTGRKDPIADPEGGPGTYNQPYKFGDDSKAQVFGVRREEKIPIGPGPGQYKHESADGVVWQRNPAWELKNQTGRKETVSDPSRGPGTYDDHYKFGDDSKAQEFGVRREYKIPLGPGPGEYNHEQADGTVMQRNPAWDFKNTLGRIEAHCDPSGGPGTYNDPYKFGDDSRAQEFGFRREERIPLGPGPGQYKHEDADGITRQRNAAWDFRNQTGRKDAVADPTRGPGTYDDNYKFGDDSKAQEFGVRREEKISIGPGPGEYRHEQANGTVMQRNPAWDFKNTSGRKEEITSPNGGPGTYNHPYNFGDDSKAQEFGIRREQKIPDGPGPGQYEHEDADGQVKPRNAVWDFKLTTGRQEIIADPNRGPGTYEDGYKFGNDSRAHDFGIRRELIIPDGPGPGEYRHEQADGIVRQRNPAWNWRNNTGRLNPVNDPSRGPGTYGDNHKFGDDSKAQEFGVRREYKIPLGPGPGEYNHEQADGTVMQRNPAWDFKNTLGRIEAHCDPSGGPGTYNDPYKFGDDSRAQEFGFRREEKIPLGPGPGQYKHEDADEITRQRSPAWDFRNQSGRKDAVADPTRGPGTYDDNYKFGDDSKAQEFGIKREMRNDITPGPGHYKHENADGVVRQRNPTWEIKNQSGRQETVIDPSRGPGTYDDNHKFGNDSKAQEFGVRRLDKISQGPGPGEYRHEQADGTVKQRNPAWDFKNTGGRKDAAIDPEGGPGTYAVPHKFGDDSKAHEFGVRREEKIPIGPGPGQYKPEIAESTVRERSPAWEFKNQTGRKDSVADQSRGPGTYDDQYRFGQDSKAQEFGIKREEKIQPGPGPADYSPERGENQTKSRSKKTDFAKTSPRKSLVIDANGGPGSYDVRRTFDEHVNGVTIGVRRDQTIEQSVGPGQYSPEKSVSVTKPSAPAANFKSKTSRLSFQASTDLGPGTYSHGGKFGEDLKKVTIGERRPQKQPKTPGPADYSPTRSITQSKSAAYLFGNRQGRTESPVDPNGGPGQYNTSLKDFGKEIGPMTIGVKHEVRIESSPGPGEYQHERADSLTKIKAPAAIFMGSASRPESKLDANRGPGTYDSPQKFGAIPGPKTIGVRREPKTPKSLGPGQYLPEKATSLTKPSQPISNFSNKKGRLSAKIDPALGPGTYKSPEKVSSPSKMTIGQRRQTKPDNKAPGPGHYQPILNQIQRSSQATGFKTGRKQEIISPSNGPGSYIGHKSSLSQKAFTIGAKRSVMQDVNPAPGQYNLNQASVRPRSPETDFKNQTGRKESKADPTGGPGTYFLPNASQDKVMTIGVKRASRVEQTPGPGQYDPERADSLTKQAVVSVDFTKQQSQRTLNETPSRDMTKIGPGLYEPQRADEISKKSVRKVNFARATSRSMSQSKSTSVIVGPGSYKIEDADQLTRFRIPSAKIPIAHNASQKTIQTMVGPGSYNELNVSSGPAYTIQERHGSKVESSPGPGQYEPNKNSSFVSSTDRKTATTSRGKANTSLLKSEIDFYRQMLINPQYGNILSASPSKNKKKPAKQSSPIKPYTTQKSAQKPAVAQDKKPQTSPTKLQYSGAYSIAKPTKQK